MPQNNGAAEFASSVSGIDLRNNMPQNNGAAEFASSVSGIDLRNNMPQNNGAAEFASVASALYPNLHDNSQKHSPYQSIDQFIADELTISMSQNVNLKWETLFKKTPAQSFLQNPSNSHIIYQWVVKHGYIDQNANSVFLLQFLAYKKFLQVLDLDAEAWVELFIYFDNFGLVPRLLESDMVKSNLLTNPEKLFEFMRKMKFTSSRFCHQILPYINQPAALNYIYKHMTVKKKITQHDLPNDVFWELGLKTDTGPMKKELDLVTETDTGPTENELDPDESVNSLLNVDEMDRW